MADNINPMLFQSTKKPPISLEQLISLGKEREQIEEPYLVKANMLACKQVEIMSLNKYGSILEKMAELEKIKEQIKINKEKEKEAFYNHLGKNYGDVVLNFIKELDQVAGSFLDTTNLTKQDYKDLDSKTLTFLATYYGPEKASLFMSKCTADMDDNTGRRKPIISP